MRVYTDHFYGDQRERSRESAREVVPLLMRLVRPRSVVDVGCGVGTWLSVFRDHGVSDTLGIDGDYVDTRLLEIPEASFRRHDLTTPFRLDRQFDLVLSLEVAEHIPPAHAETFLATLARLGPCICFSAAIPRQGGTGHVNERWQDYWAEQFRQRGYVAIDGVRERVWRNPRVATWYAQNTLLYVREDRLAEYPALARERERGGALPLAVVHPRRYLYMTDPRHLPLREVVAALPLLVGNAIRRRLRPRGERGG
ncbi:MAG TPA: class I SAM-dependent methyltransferase [Thermodesulfobacteriota bacterium]